MFLASSTDGDLIVSKRKRLRTDCGCIVHTQRTFNTMTHVLIEHIVMYIDRKGENDHVQDNGDWVSGILDRGVSSRKLDR